MIGGWVGGWVLGAAAASQAPNDPLCGIPSG